LPRSGKLGLIKAFRKRHPKLPQLACFDTAFHQTMPRVAKLLPIPRRFDAKGIQHYGFHGLSYAYLMEELLHLFPDLPITVEDAAAYAKQAAGQAEIDSAVSKLENERDEAIAKLKTEYALKSLHGQTTKSTSITFSTGRSESE